MLLGNAVKFAQMPFCLIPKVLYPIDVVLPFGKVCAVVDAQVAKLTDIRHIIALMTICVTMLSGFTCSRIIDSKAAVCVLGTATV